MNHKIIQSQPSKSTRGYLKFRDVEVHRDFILEKHDAGMRQKLVIAALEAEKGVTIKKDVNMWELLSTDMYPYSGADWEDVISAEEKHYHSAGENQSEDTIEELQDIVSAGVNNILLLEPEGESYLNTGPPSPLLTADENVYASGNPISLEMTYTELDTPMSIYIREHEQDFQDYIGRLKMDASTSLSTIKFLSKRRNVSLEEAVDIPALRQTILPSNVYKQILEDEGNISGDEITELEEFRGTMSAYKQLEANFRTVGAQLNDTMPYYKRRYFDSGIIHLPRIIRIYGRSHFFTAETLRHFADLISYGICEGNDVHIEAFQVFERIGMAHYRQVLNCLSRKPLDFGLSSHGFRETITKLQRISKMILKSYGKIHPCTISVYSIFVEHLKTTPTLDGIAKNILYGMVHTLEYSSIQITEKNGKCRHSDYPEVWKAWDFGRRNSIEYELQEVYRNILVHGSVNRSRTPDLHEFLYLQSLENWMHLQGASTQAGEVGRWVDDLDIDDSVEPEVLRIES
ncbi:hypothetical protein ABW20_dc0109753 [Dactylellina cionopaga]|nr:hypothetical protein ABW20_dc0109753 [Dactylellina cionopaga]